MAEHERRWRDDADRIGRWEERADGRRMRDPQYRGGENRDYGQDFGDYADHGRRRGYGRETGGPHGGGYARSGLAGYGEAFGRDDYGRADESARHYRGRGPKGYTRSDDRIREDVGDRLTDDAWVDASEIEVAVSECEVTLSGTVDSRTAKRRAEDLADGVSGVRHVQNNLRVRRQGALATDAAAAGATAVGATVGRSGDRGTVRRTGKRKD